VRPDSTEPPNHVLPEGLLAHSL